MAQASKQASIHTLLRMQSQVWGSLRLDPITLFTMHGGKSILHDKIKMLTSHNECYTAQ